MTAPLLVRLSSHDRALMLRCAMSPAAPRVSRLGWTAITHLGGTIPSLVAAGLPLLACCELYRAGELAMASVVLSHLLVQLVERRGGARSAGDNVRPKQRLSGSPIRFSFPSGHATASFAVALAYAMCFPWW